MDWFRLFNNIISSDHIMFVFDFSQGGFAKCYEMTDAKSRVTYAGKIVSKNRLSKPHQREKVRNMLIQCPLSNLKIV